MVTAPEQIKARSFDGMNSGTIGEQLMTNGKQQIRDSIVEKSWHLELEPLSS